MTPIEEPPVRHSVRRALFPILYPMIPSACLDVEIVRSPAPSWDVGKECLIFEFVPSPADPIVGRREGVLYFVSLFSHRLTPRGT